MGNRDRRNFVRRGGDDAASRRLADLEAQFDQARREEVRAEARQLAVAEESAQSLEDRLAAADHRVVRVVHGSGRVFEGEVVRVGSGWCELRCHQPELRVISLIRGLQFVQGDLRRVKAHAGIGQRRLLANRLEALRTTGIPVTVAGEAFEVVGRIVRVGKDHLDVLARGSGDHPPARTPAAGVSGPSVIPFAAIEAIYASNFLDD